MTCLIRNLTVLSVLELLNFNLRCGIWHFTLSLYKYYALCVILYEYKNSFLKTVIGVRN